VRADVTRYTNIRARIANESNPTVLSMQGFEGKDLHRIILYGDHYPAIEREDIALVASGRWTGSRFKVVEVRYSSVLPGRQRAHTQLVAERLRYAHENVDIEPAPADYDPPVTVGLAFTLGTITTTYVSAGDPISVWDIIQIDSERMLVVKVTPSSNTFTLGRGYQGTTIATHASGAPILKV